MKGTVKWFNNVRGFGFITPSEGDEDLFVHYSQIVQEEGYKTLKEGQEVEFDACKSEKGLVANSVRAIS